MTQADHARFASDLLALLRLPGLVDHPRRGALLAAVAAHDDGWWESDAAPRFDPATRRPLDFREIGEDERQEIWRRGVERHAGEDPYTAAVVAGHALRLLGERAAARRELLEELEMRREELAPATGLSDEELRADDRWLELADELALAAATGDARFALRDDLRVEVESGAEETRLAIAPFPLAGTTRVELSCRRLPLVSSGGDHELARALALARWERRSVRVAPLR